MINNEEYNKANTDAIKLYLKVSDSSKNIMGGEICAFLILKISIKLKQ